MCTCIETLELTHPIAKKVYEDSSAEWLKECFFYKNYDVFSFSELRAVVRFRNNNWKIMPGQKYERQRNKMDGYIYTWRSLPEIIAICNKHRIYPDFC